jgi:hypothetical protein
MKRIAVLAGPLFLMAAIAGAALVVHRRRASRPGVRAARIDVSVPTEPQPAARTGNASVGVEVLAGYDEQHEEEQEARHGAVLHIDVDRLSFGQI